MWVKTSARTSSPLLLLDRFTRMDVSRLLTPHSRTQNCVRLWGGGMNSLVLDLGGEQEQQHDVPQRKVIGVGAGLRYTLYDPSTDKADFRAANGRVQSRGIGFA